MEFPIYQWMVACVCKISGNHIVTTRLVTFIIGAFSVVAFYLLAQALFKNKFVAAVGAWSFSFSPIFYYYTVNPLPDVLALCFGMYGLYFFIRYYREAKARFLILFSTFLSLACLTKLPFILFSIPFIVYWFTSERKLKEFLITLVILLPAIMWYAAVIGTWNDNGIIKGVLDSNMRPGMYLYHLQGVFVSMFPELFINYAAVPLFCTGVFFILKRKVITKSNPITVFFVSGMLGVMGYVLFELNMITTEHDYYYFPFLPYIFLIISFGFKVLIERSSKAARTFALALIVLLPLTAFLRINTRWNLVDPGFNPELLNHKMEIQALIPENAICLTGNDDSRMINLYYLNRKGYTFYNDDLDANLIEEYKKGGVSYLVSDAVLKEDAINALPTAIASFGNLKIYKLK